MSIVSASHSEIETFTECERKHYYRYGKKLESITSSDAMARGSIIHQVLAIYYQARKVGNTHQDAMESALTDFNLIFDTFTLFDPDKMRRDVLNLLYWYWEVYGDENIVIHEVEVEYNVQLTDGFVLPVVLDLIAEIPGYPGVGLIDHKVTTDFYSVDKVDMQPQLPRYLAACMELGIHIDYLMYNQIRSRAFKNEPDFRERYLRTPVPITTGRMVNTMREHLVAAGRIMRYKAAGLERWEQQIIRNPAACQYCFFKDLCDSDLNERGDSKLVEENFYVHRKGRHE